MNIEQDRRSFLARVPEFKASLQDSLFIFSAALFGCNVRKPYQEAYMMLNELKQLGGLLDMSEPELVQNIPRIAALLRYIGSKVPRMDSILDELFLEGDENLEKVVMEICHPHEQEGTSEDTRSGSSSQANLGNQPGNNEKGIGKTKKKPKGKRKGKK
ncbi:hypothetical protein M5689_000998 [Euphorbia peplus]|nr:hypothetical protein M5689_000998 [Euphorbia peplus]